MTGPTNSYNSNNVYCGNGWRLNHIDGYKNVNDKYDEKDVVNENGSDIRCWQWGKKGKLVTSKRNHESFIDDGRSDGRCSSVAGLAVRVDCDNHG